ncbi:RHS repeat domain-containing protein [Paludibacterium yongneupense]|uniref:RHS repeat domain-containing protein n=1 Tax=Paludibacterium yongneupense TaxID=400061 RepID=UPI001C0416BB|nr:DUF6443 domain-containing protein [Paludibacterium yongneupense]
MSTYSYTTSNYLGNGAAFTSNWNSYSDNLYQVLVDTYTYGSTETRVYSESSGNNMTIERTYNSLHLQISEAVHQGTSSCRQRTDIEYYVTPGQTFDSQVPQFQFPKKQTLTWTDTSKPKGQQDRSEITLTAYDGNGNQISQTDPDGTVTSWTYYSSNGETSGAGANKITLCPPDPYGFTRYVKTVTVTPKSTSQGEPVRSKTYRWQRIITPGGFAVVKNYLDLSSGGSVIANEQCTYTTTTGSNFGRMASLTHTYYNQTQSWQTSLAFSFSITGDSLTQGLTVTGHDALTASAQRQLSRFTGRTLSSTDPQGNVTQYTYDVLGRTLSRVLNPGTQYANTTSWSYRDSDHAIITTDANGNKATAYQDGLGRTLKQTIQPAGSSTESILATQTYDSFGRPLTATSYDYLPGKTTTTLALQATTVYDNWGQAQSVSYSDGHVELSASDPVAQTTKTQLQAAAGTVNPPIQGWQITHFNIQKLPLTVTTYHAVGTVASTSSQSYDSLGRLLTATDEIGNVTAYAYDTLGRVTTQTLPDGTSVARGYASSSLRALVASIAVTPLNAKAIPLGTQTFDSFGRTLTTASGGRTTTASYTGAGPFPNQVTAPSGTQQNFSYIPQLDNAILQVSAGALQQDFSYNAVTGLMGSASDSTVSNGRISSSIGDSMSWDTMGMLTGETFTPLSGSSKSASRTWSPGGRALTYADVTGKTTTTLYDSYGYPSGLNDPEATVTLARDALGRPITQTTTNIVDGSKLIISIAWNEFNQESTRTVKDGSNTPQLSIVSSYRPNGQLHHKTTSKGSATLRDEEFTFDNRNRLVKYVCTGTERPQDPYGKTLQSQSYTYDALSNIKTLVTEFDSGTGKATDTATFNYSNPSDPCQLSSVSHTHSAYPKSINLGYDANGRMTTDETGRTLAYDALGRLSTSSGGSVPTGTYRYDAFDALAMQQVGNDSHELYYRDGIQVNELVPAQNRKVRMLKIGNQSVGISDSNPPAAKTADAANDDTPQPEQGEQA